MAAVTLVAVVAAGGFVGLTRWAPGSAAGRGQHPGVPAEEPPDVLAGGHEPPPVPDEVADAADGPVLAAAVLEELPEGVHCPAEEVAWVVPPETRWVLVTPDGLQARLVGEGRHRHEGPPALPPPEPPAPRDEAQAQREEPDPRRPADPGADDPAGNGRAGADEPVAFEVNCEAEWDGVGWHGSGGSVGRTEQVGVGARMSGASCCDADGLGTAHAEVPVGAEVAWVLQDRGGYWLAYPVEGPSVVMVTWRFRGAGFGDGPGFGETGMGEGATFVRLLDEDADVVDERWIG